MNFEFSQAKICILISVGYKIDWMGRKKLFTKYRCDANLLFPSYVYDPTNTETETKGEISL